MSISQKEQWVNSTEESKNNRIEALRRGCEKQLLFQPTVPENKVAKILDSKNIKYTRNAPLYGKFLVDFLLDDGRIIEVFGDYWHGNPLKYSNLNKRQQSQQNKDKSRLAYLRKCGREIIVVWENRKGRFDHSEMEKYINDRLG